MKINRILYRGLQTPSPQNRDYNRSLIQVILWHHFALRMLFYASDLLARKLVAEIVTRLLQPESCDVNKNAGWL